jgi:hypothetical protein
VTTAADNAARVFRVPNVFSLRPVADCAGRH